jgi:hypothetical protein
MTADCKDSAPYLIGLVPAFAHHPSFPATFYAGFEEFSGEAARTQNLPNAPRFHSRQAAERVRRKLLPTMSCIWAIFDLSDTQPQNPQSAVPRCLSFASTGHENAPSVVGKLTIFSDLWVGDRFFLEGSPLVPWTKLGPDTAREHSLPSIALAERGFGYLGDTICSFDRDDPVKFQPPASA